MAVYYIDNVNGIDENDGLSPEKAKKRYDLIDVRAGDTLLFKRGTIHRSELKTWEGKEGAWVTYGAYGEGEMPIFCSSTDVSGTEDWVEIEENIWECQREINGEVGNFEFDVNNCSATLRWTREELCGQGDFWDSGFEGDFPDQLDEPKGKRQVLLYSHKNPAEEYSHIECISRATRRLAKQRNYNRFENLLFRNGLHGIAYCADHVEIVGCRFENIGGVVWSKKEKIRFGNAIEFYGYGSYILVENCYFKNIYDSCVTHQGPGEETVPTREFICRNNVFDTYSMAAFEYRDKMPINSSFTGNICLNAGCGFGMLGETLPRLSEIWPQPMGHHIFMWRIPKAEEGGSLVIENNYFGEALAGAAIYSIISPEAEAQVVFDNNVFTETEGLLVRWGGENFTSLEEYKSKTGQDKNSKYGTKPE